MSSTPRKRPLRMVALLACAALIGGLALPSFAPAASAATKSSSQTAAAKKAAAKKAAAKKAAAKKAAAKKAAAKKAAAKKAAAKKAAAKKAAEKKAAEKKAAQKAKEVKAVKADPATTTVSRVSVAKGPQVGGGTVIITGKSLATWDTEEEEWVAKTVKFGGVTVDAEDVEALAETALKVEVPAAAGSAKDKLNVTVLVGDAVKGPKYTYVATGVTVSVKEDFAPVVTETGTKALELAGTNFDAKTKLTIGGKAAKATITSTKITFDAPSGLVGPQDLVVTDSRNQYPLYAGYVVYTPKQITVTETSTTKALNEAATVVKLTGTNLDLVTGATFGGEKASFKKVDATKVDVTIAKGTAKTGTIKLVTKYGASAESAEIVRAASVKPTVTETTTITKAGGEVTLTGTNFTGLKEVTLKSVATGKVYKGSKISVLSETSAKVTLPAVPDNATYQLVVKNLSTTASDAFEVVIGTPPTTTTTTSEEPEPSPSPSA